MDIIYGLSFCFHFKVLGSRIITLDVRAGQVLSKHAVMFFPSFKVLSSSSSSIKFYRSAWLDRYFMIYETICTGNVFSNIRRRLFV